MKVTVPSPEPETLVEVTDVRSFIHALGGPTRVARFIQNTDGKAQSGRIKSWSIRGAIPTGYWPALIEMAEIIGLDGVDAAFLLALMQRSKKLTRS
jgi:hypothetical protein